MYNRISHFILTALFMLCSSFYASAEQQHEKFATLDWTVAETLLALGENPVAVGDKKSYTKWVAYPELPDSTIDLGVRMQPNLELLIPFAQNAESSQLIFINSSFYTSATPMLSQFSRKVEIVDFYGEGYIWRHVIEATKKIAQLIGKDNAFEQLIANYKQKIDEIRPHLQSLMHRPIALVQFIDTRHLRIYAQNSLLGAVLFQLGFENAWNGSHNQWGFETIDITQLAKLPTNTRLVVIKPYPANVKHDLKYNTLWQHLRLSADPVVLPAIWTFGGIPSAQRFAESLKESLLNGGEIW
ncbi:iron complex transport system substrate-binding protein [Pasteurella langaaensis DSM 22999]|uniref:Iron complex transport system substrate-binding protein n=2 Tax=Alitibacter langaaensis TaxID=756 RepID=A0A2U0SMW3_9PAST|nr:iron complex transport system substrate-binding protein [Pasteurella langaaensis DSM 22999]